MHDCRAKLILLQYICFRILYQEFDQVVVPMISSEVKSSKFFICALIGPLAQSLPLLLKFKSFQIKVQSVVVQYHEGFF